MGPLRSNGVEKFATAVIFMMPVLALTSSAGMSVVQLLILLMSAAYVGKGYLAYCAQYRRQLAWIMLGFGGYFAISLGRLLVFHQTIHTLDGPSRLLFALTCIGFVAYFRPRIRWFWIGVCCAAIGSGVLALVQHYIFGMYRAVGFTYHAITFGDLALALGVMSLCALSEFRKTRLAYLPVTALLCGLLASVLSESRGSWIALLFVVVPLLIYGRSIYGRRIVLAVVLMGVMSVLAYFIPATGVAERVGEAIMNAHAYINSGDANNSGGIRLELWKASWMMFVDHPWFGVGRDSFHDALQSLLAQGRLQPSRALTYASSHNDVLNFLATGGLVDCSFLLLMYFGPLCIFLSVLRKAHSEYHAAALAGVILVACFVAFGLTDVMFWLMAPKVFYGMMVCTLIGFCLAPFGSELARAADDTHAVPMNT